MRSEAQKQADANYKSRRNSVNLLISKEARQRLEELKANTGQSFAALVSDAVLQYQAPMAAPETQQVTIDEIAKRLKKLEEKIL